MDYKEVDGNPRQDAGDSTRIGFGGIDESEDPLRIGAQPHSRTTGRPNVDLDQDEYKPEEVARLLGTTVEVVMRAIYEGELKADRQGQDVVCITHTDLADWLARRGPGV